MNITNVIVGVSALSIIVGGVTACSGKGAVPEHAVTQEKVTAAITLPSNNEKLMNQEKKEEGAMVGRSLMVQSLDIVDNASLQ